MPAFEILAQGPFTPEQIRVHGMVAKAIADAEARERIEERWGEYEIQARQQGGSLFNGRAACLKDWSITPAQGLQPRELHLSLAPTDYKSFLVTVLRDRDWFQAHAPRAMAPALGNSILLTFGDQVLLGVRSGKVAAYAHHAHLIGGVLDQVPGAGIVSSASLLLEHLYAELCEELSLLPHELRAPRVLGLFRDSFLAQPELVWHAELSVPPAQVAARHANEEHSDIWIGPLSHVMNSLHPLTPVAAEACRLVQDKCM